MPKLCALPPLLFPQTSEILKCKNTTSPPCIFPRASQSLCIVSSLVSPQTLHIVEHSLFPRAFPQPPRPRKATSFLVYSLNPPRSQTHYVFPQTFQILEYNFFHCLLPQPPRHSSIISSLASSLKPPRSQSIRSPQCISFSKWRACPL